MEMVFLALNVVIGELRLAKIVKCSICGSSLAMTDQQFEKIQNMLETNRVKQVGYFCESCEQYVKQVNIN